MQTRSSPRPGPGPGMHWAETSWTGILPRPFSSAERGCEQKPDKTKNMHYAPTIPASWPIRCALRYRFLQGSPNPSEVGENHDTNFVWLCILLLHACWYSPQQTFTTGNRHWYPWTKARYLWKITTTHISCYQVHSSMYLEAYILCACLISVSSYGVPHWLFKVCIMLISLQHPLQSDWWLHITKQIINSIPFGDAQFDSKMESNQTSRFTETLVGCFCTVMAAR